MARNFVRPVLWCIVLLSLWGCSSLWPQKKQAVNAPVILEEDVPEKPTPGQEAAPGVQNPPGTETIPPGVGNQPETQFDPANRPPRRLKFRDKRGWESLPNRPDAKQP